VDLEPDSLQGEQQPTSAAAEDQNIHSTSNSQPSATEQLSEVTRCLTAQLSEAYSGAREHVDQARPHVAEGIAYFKQQVVDDFKTTSSDMKEAFGSHENMVCKVAGSAAGVVAAARLMPIRSTRLAAHSLAAMAGRQMPSVEVESDAPRTDSSNAASEFDHFKDQVAYDFRSSRKDVNTAFNYIFGQPAPADSNLEGSGHSVPTVVATVVGGSAAACLLPLRAARLVVAKARAQGSADA
jgi:hypothetical protein